MSLILNRVQEAKHWKDMGSKEWGRTLMVAHYDEIDWSYCHENASKFGCRDRLEEIQKEAKRIKRQMDCWCKVRYLNWEIIIL